MSLEIELIRKRLNDLKDFRKKGLAVVNATENYVSDVGDLLRITDALRETVALYSARIRQLEGKPPLEKKFFLGKVDSGITRLLNGNFKHPPRAEETNGHEPDAEIRVIDPKDPPPKDS